jgi:hypothetical protein
LLACCYQEAVGLRSCGIGRVGHFRRALPRVTSA